MSKKKKISRKELLRQDDAFIQAANQSAEWFKENQTTITAATVAVIVGILATWGGILYAEEQNRAASAQLMEAFAIYDAAVVDDAFLSAPLCSAILAMALLRERTATRMRLPSCWAR